MNVLRDLPCEKTLVTSGCQGVENQEIRKFLKIRKTNYSRCKMG